MPIPVRAALGALVGLVLLSACSAPAAPTSAPATSSATSTSAPATTGSTQTASEACTALSASMNDAAKTMQSAMSDVGSDPSKAVKALQAFQDTFEQAVTKVTNPEVRAQADKALAATKKYVTALDAVVKDPTKVSGLSDTMTEFQTEMTKIGTVCSG